MTTSPTAPESPISPDDARLAADLLGEVARKMRDDADTVGALQRAEGLAGVATYLSGAAAAFASAQMLPSETNAKMAAAAHALAIHRDRSHEDAIVIALGALIYLVNTSSAPASTIGVLIDSLEVARALHRKHDARATA
jgi:hypothetical protein